MFWNINLVVATLFSLEIYNCYINRKHCNLLDIFIGISCVSIFLEKSSMASKKDILLPHECFKAFRLLTER